MTLSDHFPLELIRLHHHWLVADSVKESIKAYRRAGGPEIEPRLPEPLRQIAQQLSFFNVLKVWYALLYVVIEGYGEIALSSNVLDELLSDQEKVQALRRFRNAVFHFQGDVVFSPKELEFLNADFEGEWIRKVNKAFDKFFSDHLPIRQMLEDFEKLAK